MFVCVVCKKTLSILDNEICNDCHKYIQNIKQKNVEKHCTLCKKEAPSMKEKLFVKNVMSCLFLLWLLRARSFPGFLLFSLF